ncbi:DUF2129 domain-containing protein [Lactococcus hircilactis]|uniref:DUF2129 domain-containing protein n=1 Tax=Lactococcus hircilactis TaxID=1494462 RepID=A0A7X1Z8X3_9LACT|nr:DUF2129 domain-containing protein [Lactococcus hircilactis]
MESSVPLQKQEIRSLEISGRVPLYVYCSSYKGTRQLSRYGDTGYVSTKLHFTLIYVNESEADEKIEQIQALKFVKKVERGHLKELNQNFSEAFLKTNLEIKAEMDAQK